jgi:hypothetical protein
MADTYSGGQGLPWVSGGVDQPMGMVLFPEQQGSESCPFPMLLPKAGGIGFQYEGGVIQVDGQASKIVVSFDRPMTYSGIFTNPPVGSAYSLAQPFLEGDPTAWTGAMALDLPFAWNGYPASFTARCVTAYDAETADSNVVNVVLKK